MRWVLPVLLSAGAGASALVALEALLRVCDFEAFASLLPVYDRVSTAPRQRRELLARLYFRRGYLESAAEEWTAVVEDEPDAEAYVGLAQVAFAMGLAEDALVLAEEALELDPGCTAARQVWDGVRRRRAIAA